MRIAIMPYFAQENKGWIRYTPLEKNYEFLEATCKSLEGFVDKIYVGCQNELDHKDVNKLSFEYLHLKIEPILLEDTIPHHLTMNTVKYVQKNLPIECTQIYYTESDQILHVENKNYMDKILVATVLNDDNVFLVPHRFDQLPQNKIDIRLKKHNTPKENIVNIKSDFHEGDNVYVVSNHLLEDEGIFPYQNKPSFCYINQSEDSSYGGAWLCNRGLFLNTDFTVTSSFGEQTGGRVLFNKKGAISLKTMDYFMFYVEHLSAYYQNKEIIL